MAIEIFYTGVVFHLVWRLIAPFALFQRQLEKARQVGLARTRLPMFLAHLLVGLVWVAGGLYCHLSGLWITLGAFAILAGVRGLVAFARPGEPLVLDLDETELRALHRSQKLTGSLMSAGLLALWLFSWYGVAY